MDDMTFLLSVFGLFALLIGVLFFFFGRWMKVIAVLLAVMWLYQAQWYVRAYVDVRGIDDSHSRYQQDAVIAAIKAGKTKIPLAETTDFEWSAVCHLFAEQKYAVPDGKPLTWQSEIMREVLGTDNIPYFENNWWWREYFVLVFATPTGPYVMEPVWGRFSRKFQQEYVGRHYAKELGGKGYWIEEKMHERDGSGWGSLCFKPEDAWLEISPEPPWTDDIKGLVDEMRKKKP